ncbi:hypothetical protein L9F63_015887, partial [Diploptera punctata]
YNLFSVTTYFRCLLDRVTTYFRCLLDRVGHNLHGYNLFSACYNLFSVTTYFRCLLEWNVFSKFLSYNLFSVPLSVPRDSALYKFYWPVIIYRRSSYAYGILDN